MRLLVFLMVVLAGNWLSFVLATRPALNEREGLGLRQRELDEAIASRRREAGQWRRLENIVELAQDVLRHVPSRDKDSLSDLRTALLDAEQGLPLQRVSLEFHPESKPPAGYRGFRVVVSERGDLASLRTYLERVSLLGVPMAPVEMSLVEDRTGSNSLRLSAIWRYLVPEE